jgi:Ca-activated chloride channel family protein
MVCPFFLVWITNQLARRLAHQLGNRMKSSSRTMEQTYRIHRETGKARSAKSGLAGQMLVAVVAILISLGVTPGVRGNVPSISQGRRLEQNPAEQSPESSKSQEKPKPVPSEPASKSPKTPPGAAELEAESIRIDSSLVVVPVSVTDHLGQPIRDLNASDFILEEEGVRQQVQTLGDPGKTPIELALLFDVSRSVRSRFDFEKTAAGRFLEVVLKPGDFASVFSIGRTAHLTVERTDSAESAIAKTLAIEPTDEATAFFDTVVAAAQYIEKNAPTGARRVMVVISDGEDNNSELNQLRDALRETQSSNALFYSINPSGPSIRLNRMSIRGHDGMVRLANDTGGMAFLPDKIEDLTQVFAHIAAELQAQYLLGYYPNNDQNDGKFRRITVRIDKQPELRVRSRNGYYAPKE